jgi:phage shock protein C
MEASTMDDQSARPCPFCAETIAAAAVRCPHCRSFVNLSDARGWYRSHPGKKIGGVCVAISHALGMPVTPVRLGFVLLTLLHLTGALAYLVLWLVIPEQPGQQTAAVRAFSSLVSWIKGIGGGRGGGGDGGPSEVDRVP